MRQSFAAGLVAGLLAVIVWGVQFPIAKDAFAVVDPFHVTLIRYLIAVLILTPVVLLREGRAALSYQGLGPLVCRPGGAPRAFIYQRLVTPATVLMSVNNTKMRRNMALH